MSKHVSADGVDVEAVMADIRERIAEKKRRGLLTDEEVREISERPLHPVLDAHDFRSRLLAELLSDRERWGYSFSPQQVYGSSRGGAGRLLEKVRRLLNPIQKLFWNPNPMISALSRQSDLNQAYVHLIHNLAEPCAVAPPSLHIVALRCCGDNPDFDFAIKGLPKQQPGAPRVGAFGHQVQVLSCDLMLIKPLF